MSGFYRRALSIIKKLTVEQCRELLVSASGDIFRMETVLDSLPSGILVCDEKNMLVIANKSSLRLLPLSHPDNRPMWELIYDEDVASFFQQTLQNCDHVLEREMDVEAHGTVRLLSISVYPLVDRRKITGSLVYIEDITEKRNREIQLRRAENLASLTTLAAGVAHEIKNPLGAISIHLQLMQKKLALSEDVVNDTNKNVNSINKNDNTINKYFDIINEEIDRLNKIVVDFLYAVRPVPLELREANLNALVAEVGEFTRGELEQSHIRLLLEFDEKLPPVLFDERHMKQVMLNLIKNSQAAMPNGGLLTIATIAADNEVRISICDTGVGMGEERLKRIFEPYFTTKDNGTGLGLTMVYKIVREHQGEIIVDSREGEGTDFEIILPVYQKERRLITSGYDDKDSK